MTIAIMTTFHGPTNSRGSRIIAKTLAGDVKRATFDYHSLDGSGAYEKHATAARTLAEALNWSGEWVQGDAGDSSYVFVRGAASFKVEG